MDISSVTLNIKTMLGFPVVSVHTPDESIKMNLEKALRKYSSKILDEKLIVVPYDGGSRIDLTEYKVEVVTQVTPSLRSSSGYSEFNEFDMRAQEWNNIQGGDLQSVAFAKMRQGNLNFLMDSFDFDFRDNYLYVDNIPYGSNELTVIALTKPTIETHESNWVEEYAFALTKVIEGRIRSKYSGGPMEFENDGQALIDEGTTELRDLEESLKGKAPMNFMRRA